ncbi:MAG: hypothetical protein LBV79_12250, partial [Candidatus Adiutrix sp.]|nr:hypothetical protein [Candidatus Adiutrix sp.]
MTIETQSNRVQYIGNGAATVFPLPFPVYEESTVRLYQGLGPGQKEVAQGFQVTGAGTASVDLVMDAPPGHGLVLTMMRMVPYTQEMSLENGGAFNAQTLEEHFDRQEMQIQQLAEEMERAIKHPESA